MLCCNHVLCLVLQALERQWEAQSIDFANYWLMKRSFWLWHRSGSLAAAATQEKLSVAMAMAFQNTSCMVLLRWQQWVALQQERRHRLGQAFALVVDAEQQNGLQQCFGVWQRYRRQGQLLSAKSDVALLHSQRRMLQDIFSTWAAYTAAMKADVQPDSPFLSPRNSKVCLRVLAAPWYMPCHDSDCACKSSHQLRDCSILMIGVAGMLGISPQCMLAKAWEIGSSLCLFSRTVLQGFNMS